LYRREHRLLLEYERRMAREFAHSLVCTPRELEDFKRLIPGVPVSCVSNGVDLEYFKPAARKKISGQVIFTGVMDYFPNVEGITWFCRNVLPLIRAEFPALSLTICGARPDAQVQALGRLPGVRITGRVPDVRPYLEESTVCIVPLRIARGIQNKLLEAMSMGLAVVSCSAASTGVEAVPGRDLEVADEPHAFASAVLKLLRDDAFRESMGRSARACMESHYRWEHQLQRLDEVVASVCPEAVLQSRPASSPQKPLKT
jgi:sugar transferase (PEP-CTERM/EpsH1 system associated)